MLQARRERTQLFLLEIHWFLAFSITRPKVPSFLSTISQTSHHPPASCYRRSRPPVVLLIADLLSSPFSSSSLVCGRCHSRPHSQFAIIVIAGGILVVSHPSSFSPFSCPLAVYQRQRPPLGSSAASSPRRPSSVTSPASSPHGGSHSCRRLVSIDLYFGGPQLHQLLQATSGKWKLAA
ncbi:hypothetical protein ACLOJK_000644 [Asimina triloba]